MSGAEAILGVIAGGAGVLSLSIQLGESIMKLRRIYKTVNNVPKRLERLSHDLDIMRLALEQLEQQCSSFHCSVLLSMCIGGCRRDIGEIADTASKLELQIARSRITGKIHASSSQRDMNELLDSLERSKASLQVAYMMCLGEEHRCREEVTHAILMAQTAKLELLSIRPTPQALTRATSSAPLCSEQSNDDAHTACRQHAGRRRRKSKPRVLRLRARLPAWLCNRLWAIAITSSMNGWCMTLTTYNIVPSDAQIFELCEAGDLDGMRCLIETGQASLLDADDQDCIDGSPGWTLLKVAAYCQHEHICRFLLQHSAYPDQCAILKEALLTWSGRARSAHEKDSRSFYRMILDRPDCDVDLLEEDYVWFWTCRDTDTLDIILNTQSQELNMLSREDRFRIAVKNHYMPLPHFLRCVGLSDSPEELVHLRYEGGKTILHYIMHRLTALHNTDNEKWMQLAASVIKCGLNPISPWRPATSATLSVGTPLSETICRMQLPSAASHCLEAIRSWGRILQLADVDIDECGRHELQVWPRVFEKVKQNAYQMHSFVKMTSLVYGSDPEAWDCVIDITTLRKLYRGNCTPGAWVDHRLPQLISWAPNDAERREGAWTVAKVVPHVTGNLMLKDVQDVSYKETPADLVARLTSKATVKEAEPFDELVEATQDDSGVVVRLLASKSRSKESFVRSRSQLPRARHAKTSYRGSGSRRWLERYHFCPLSLHWCFHCPTDHARCCSERP